MAARENQGLQIALIIFVMLSIGTSVTTYLFFSNWKENERKAAAAEQKASEAATKKSDSDKQNADLIALIGNKWGSDAKSIHDGLIGDFNAGAYSALGLNDKTPDDQKTVTKIINEAKTTLDNYKKTIGDREKERDQFKNQLTQADLANQGKLKQVEAARDAAVKTLEEEQKKYKDAADALKLEKDQLVQDKAELNKQREQLKTEYDQKMAVLTSQLAKANTDVAKIKDELAKFSKIDPSVMGGRITWINQRDNMAYLNLGSDDGLRRRISFSVYPSGTTDVAKATPKGKLEVVNVTGPHESEARIIDNPITNPLLPGDLVHTVGWHPGQHEHFAIAGFVDLDGNGTDQTKKLHDLILANGGFVDAEIVEIKGPEGKPTLKVNGNVNVNTRYLIMGDMESPAARERLTASTTLQKEAKNLNVETIGLQKFLGMMGYTPRASAAGGAAAATGAAAAGADDKDNGGFRPRKPPARGKDDSAF